MKTLVLTLALVFSFAVGVNAQTPTPTPTDAEFDLIERAQMVAEIKSLREQNAAKDTIIAEQKDTISVLKRLDTVNESRIADLKEALKFRTEANNIDIKIENMYKERVAEFKDENQRLRDENAKLRKSRDRRSLIFGAIGLAAGKFIF